MNLMKLLVLMVHMKLSHEFVKEFYTKMDPAVLAKNPSLELSMLREYDVTDYYLEYEYKYENMTEEEIEKYINKISPLGLGKIENNPKISVEFKNKYNLL